MTYTQAQIDKANAVDLEKFLRAQGETLVRSGKEYRWKSHDSLTVCGNKWFRHSQSKGGFPVDFVMEFYGKSFPEAVQMLTGEPGEVQPEADPAPSPAFRLPLRKQPWDSGEVSARSGKWFPVDDLWQTNLSSNASAFFALSGVQLAEYGISSSRYQWN